MDIWAVIRLQRSEKSPDRLITSLLLYVFVNSSHFPASRSCFNAVFTLFSRCFHAVFPAKRSEKYEEAEAKLVEGREAEITAEVLPYIVIINSPHIVIINSPHRVIMGD